MQCKRFLIDETEALDLAGLLAKRAGWLGPYPGNVGDATALLVVKPLAPQGSSAHPPWCTFCGRHKVSRMMNANPCSICDDSKCLGWFTDIADELEDSANAGSAPPGQGCALCFREDVKVIAHRYTGICIECVRLVADIFKENSS